MTTNQTCDHSSVGTTDNPHEYTCMDCGATVPRALSHRADMEHNIEVKRYKGTMRGNLTTNHAASNYGQPIMLVGGIAYGPADAIPEMDGTAWIAADPNAPKADHDAVLAFNDAELSAWLATVARGRA